VRKGKPEDCPIGLDKVHCQNCYFWRDGKCDYDAIMREHKTAEETLNIYREVEESRRSLGAG